MDAWSRMNSTLAVFKRERIPSRSWETTWSLWSARDGKSVSGAGTEKAAAA